MKKIVISGYIGFKNFGDEAIFMALSSHLKKIGCEVSILCKDKNASYDAIKYNYKSLFDVIKALIKNDILISGGGSLLQNKTSNFSLIYYLSIIILAKLFFKKVIIFAQGFEKIKGRFFEKLLAFVLKRVDLITVRDEKSKNYLQSLNINNAFLVSDPIYSYLKDVQVKQEKKDFIIQLRDFKGLKEEFLDNLVEVILKYYQGEIKLLSMQDSFDKRICEIFSEKLNKFNIKNEILYSKTNEEIVDILNNGKYVISTRLHGLLTANALYSRALGLSYDEKIKTACQELKIKYIDIFNYTKEEMDKKIDEFLNANINEVHYYRPFEWNKIDDSILK